MSEQPPDRPSPPPSSLPPAPPPLGLLRKEETPLMEYLRKRMEILERELAVERERARAAEGLVKQQETLRGEVEGQLKGIADQMRQEKALREAEHDKTASHGRIEALEQRLDEMHKTWASLLKDAIGRRELGLSETTASVEKLSRALDELRQDFASLQGSVAGVAQFPAEVQELRTLLPVLAKARTEDETLLREQLREMLSAYGEAVASRMKDIGARLAEESGRQRERVEQLVRDRATLAAAFEEQKGAAREEALKERAQLQRHLDEQLALLRESVAAFASKQGEASDVLSDVRKLAEAVHALLQRPEKAKDQILQEAEGEKRDLMHALKERTEQLRAYAIERREVERSLGESLMDLNRQLEGERAAHQSTRSQVAGLERAADALRAEAELLQKELAAKDDRFAQLSAERDALLASLAEEAEKVRRRIEERTRSEGAWEARLLELQKLVTDEREQRAKAELSISELRAQAQTLSDHLGRVLREKETTDARGLQWQKEREDLLEQLRKKDDMIAMLSATFRNLLKKPST